VGDHYQFGFLRFDESSDVVNTVLEKNRFALGLLLVVFLGVLLVVFLRIFTLFISDPSFCRFM